MEAIFSGLGNECFNAQQLMNFLVGFVILACLIGSEICGASVTTELWQRILLVGLVSLSVPGLAFFQTLVIGRRFRQEDLGENQRESMTRRLSICHCVVWFCASLAIIVGLRWQDVVRENWNLDRFPLVDEICILSPILFSLVASWAIFYELQKTINRSSAPVPMRTRIKHRLSYVSIRFRVYVLLVLAPIGLAVLLRDLSPLLIHFSPANQYLLLGVAGITATIGFPFLLLLIWRNRPVEPELRSKLISICEQHRLQIRDVRIWMTGNQIVNALVAGVAPRLRFILLSDRLVNHFPENELLAVVRHEAGHLRLCHVPIRIAFIVLPLIALSLDETNAIGLFSGLNEIVAATGLPAETTLAILSIAYIAYLFVSMSWLSRNMEYEADIYSCNDLREGRPVTISKQYAQDMSDALLRLIAENPGQFQKRTLLHPSIEERLEVLKHIQNCPAKASQFCQAFARRRRIAFCLMAAVCVLALLARLM